MTKTQHLGKSGSCIVCLRGTDTGIAFDGDQEWLAAGLVALGVPTDEAIKTIEAQLPAIVSANVVYTAQTGRLRATFTVCQSCASKGPASFPKPTLLVAGATVHPVAQPAGV